MDHYCYMCFVFVMLSRLIIAELWSSAGKGPRSLDSLVCDVSLCFVTFKFDILGQVWYLIKSIPELCLLAYFVFCHFLIWCLG